MNALVKKEIRLLLPSWVVAMLLALVQAITQPYDFYIAWLLFFGLTIMALTTIGREASLNTLSTLLAQPAERILIWKTKLSVLVAAFLSVFFVWLAAFAFAYLQSYSKVGLDVNLKDNSYNLFITVCLIATATFTGGLWTTLLLRQIAGAFWLTLLVPAVLSGFSAVFFAESESAQLAIAVLSVVIAIYSVAGFIFARWLFFRAQDVGWSGGTLSLPDWKIFSARSETAGLLRTRRPIFALLKKECQINQPALIGAAVLLVLHLSVLALRSIHQFPQDSAGEVLTSIFWLLWLLLPVIIGNLSVAEERRLGVMEGQLCLPASRRRQFVIKAFMTLFLGTLLGGVIPALLETIGAVIGSQNPMFVSNKHTVEFGLAVFLAYATTFSASITLVGFFASSLAKNFLQSIGYAIATFVTLTLLIPAFAHGRMFPFDSLPAFSVLPLIIAVPTIIVTLLCLSYVNYKNFRDGWVLWRRNILGLAGSIIFIAVSSSALYHRAWEAFEPAEPAHGLAKFSLANPPAFITEADDNLLIRLPDGRVWFDYLAYRFGDYNPNHHGMEWEILWQLINKMPRSGGPQKFLSGSNWASVTARHLDVWAEREPGSKDYLHLFGFTDSVGVQSNGTLWASDKSNQKIWTADQLTRFGDETNWQQVAPTYSVTSVLLLKKDGTLWQWGTNHFGRGDWPQDWPGIRTFQPSQIGTNDDWDEIHAGSYARKADGRAWWVYGNQIHRETNFDQIPFPQNSGSWNYGAYVRKDGTLWVYNNFDNYGHDNFKTQQSGQETNWVAVARTWEWMVALKSDGTLWKWDHMDREFPRTSPTRLGIHHDWVAITAVQGGVVSFAADGSLWFWPNRNSYEYQQILVALPKQPEFLGNVFGKGK